MTFIYCFFFFGSNFEHGRGSVVEHLFATQKSWVRFPLEPKIFIISLFAPISNFCLRTMPIFRSQPTTLEFLQNESLNAITLKVKFWRSYVPKPQYVYEACR